MSSSIQAIHDDESQWAYIRRVANIPEVSWSVYSREATVAKQGYTEHVYTGKQLKLYVKQQCELNDLKQRHSAEWKELALLLDLENKYG
jgi:hypothetical protein